MGPSKIVIYDSDCAFCTWCVRFVLKHDKAKVFSFAGLSSETAKTFFEKNNISDTEAVWLVQADGEYSRKSTAALRIIHGCGGIYKLAIILIIIPRFIRDFFYDILAMLRKRLIPNNVCPIIPEEEQGRFLS